MNAVTGNNEHPRYYFTADEVIFQVAHPDETGGQAALQRNTADAILAEVDHFLSRTGSQRSGRGWRKRLELPPASRIITFSSQMTQPTGTESLALVPLKLKEHDPKDLSPDDVLFLLNDAYTDLGDNLTMPEGQKGRKAGRTPTGVRLRDKSPFRLRTITPNWLASGLHHGKGTNGPGSIPARRFAPTADQHKFKLKGKQPFKNFSEFRMPGAEVAILDTAIPLEKFPAHIRDMGIFKNLEVILFSDFAPKEIPPLSLFDDYTEPDPNADYFHHYNARDHGTFIAGLISSLAPTAKIHLYQAFNDYGVGSFMTISEALKAAINRRKGTTPLIINCSFMLEHEMPTADDLKDADTKEKLEALKKSHTKEKLMADMQAIFDWATNCPNVLVVAAAGNDGGPNSEGNQADRADPRFPAAFNKVLSVTSLPKGHRRDPKRKYHVAAYANRAHAEGSSEDKVRRSFAIFGGDLFETTTAPLGGAMSVYIGIIPRQQENGTYIQKGNANETGWVQWAGTSFAAPVLVGLLAAKDNDLFADNPNIPYSDPEKEQYLTVDDETVILIRQGP